MVGGNEFQRKIKISKKILRNCPYEKQKKEIIELFEKTKNTKKDDILLRLIVIDSCYSTNMNKRLFGFEDLTEKIKDKLESQKNRDLMKRIIDKSGKNEYVDDYVKALKKFIEDNIKWWKEKVGIDKKGKPNGHAFSLITKYIYFRTERNFPIYDSLVFKGLYGEKKYPKPSQDYFDVLIKLKKKYKVSFDELDQYFWVCGKIREGNLSLLLHSKDKYKDFLKKLKLSSKDMKKKSDKFNKIISEKLASKNNSFDDSKLKAILKLAKSIKKEGILQDINTN